jgi:ATP-dependent Clp protease ATP-binding subunit ClpC
MSINLSIPIYSERVQRKEGGHWYRVHPVFPSMMPAEIGNFMVHNPREDRAFDELTRLLRKELNDLASAMHHDALIRWSFHPELTGSKVPIQISLRKQSLSGEIFAVTYQSLGRRIVVLPKIQQLIFDLERGQLLEERANDVLTRFFRKIEKRAEGKLEIDQYLTPGSARLVTIEIEVRNRQKFKKPELRSVAAMGGGEKISGAQELEKVGRCMNRLYPARLHRAILRDDKIEAIKYHFRKEVNDMLPLVLIGPSQVGKSAIVHEFIHRMITSEDRPMREVWLVSPQRLISGMSFVGQWEERAHAIFQEVRRLKHILLIEDLPSLFQAGKTRDSDLTVGQVLKSYFEGGGIRLIAEATPESWRKIREIDRGFADHFRTIPIEQTSKDDTLRIMIRTVQIIESRDRDIYFNSDIIPMVYELQNRFSRLQAFPGKAVDIIHQISQKFSGRSFGREDVFEFFQSRTGIKKQFLRQQNSLSRDDILAFFEARVKGQKVAVNAMTDLVVNCIAQINEAGCPMGSMLFMGPTGVGKTESARAIAEYFFGTAERLLRFDMNEFVSHDAAERLIGSSYRPRGLLTAAVRRQPYSVILLDEIEKAHGRVFDLLLQVLGDGRLTDASGETADFCNCIIVMTSNLGALEAKRGLGFTQGASINQNVYREAAERFFRPELFNRIGHIIPFGELSRQDIASLVGGMTAKALSRAGLADSQISIKIQPEVFSKLAELGFKPEFGARALRRSLEDFLIEPIAFNLSQLPKNQPAIVTCSCDASGRIVFSKTPLVAASLKGFIFKSFRMASSARFVEQVNEFLLRIEDDLEDWRDESDGVIDPSDPLQIKYFSLREDIIRIRRMRDYFESAVEEEIQYRKNYPGKPSRHPVIGNNRILAGYDPESFLREMYRTTDPDRFLRKAVEAAEPFDHLRQLAVEIVNRANSVDLVVNCTDGSEGRCLMECFGPDSRELFDYWRMSLKNWSAASERYTVKEHFLDESDGFLIAEGPGIFEFVKSLSGTHLLIQKSGKVAFATLRVIPLALNQQALDCAALIKSIPAPDRFSVNLILGEAACQILDVTTGVIDANYGKGIWNLINPHLPVAEEFADFVEKLA